MGLVIVQQIQDLEFCFCPGKSTGGIGEAGRRKPLLPVRYLINRSLIVVAYIN